MAVHKDIFCTLIPPAFFRHGRLIILLFSIMILFSCEKDETDADPFLQLKTGVAYTPPGGSVPLGGVIRIGVLASGGGVPLTYLRIQKISGGDTSLQIDRGLYAENAGLDEDFVFSKDTAQTETWLITVMNAGRKETSAGLVIHRGSGSAWGPVNHYQGIVLGLQSNTVSPHYLDARKGLAYTNTTVAGHEAEIDIVGYFYFTSGKPSPTLTCPAYPAAGGYYPQIASWTSKRMTLYDYYSTDNDLVSAAAFDAAVSDSLLVNAYNPRLVSGNCKFCYTGKVIPFKTQDNKYGLIKVVHAGENESGTIEIEIKVQP
ncbi:MAG TPA: hypothetical protein P5531_13255 [Bacteroidales bacterium]|nr:hypothetical protein [Bacteroidales bacterium]HSA44556.1 hypothetical protein [Bacteroidales bacterium]